MYWIKNTEVNASPRVMLISAVAPLKRGTNSSCSINPIDPTPGSKPIQFPRSMKIKKVAIYLNTCLLLRSPITPATMPYSASIMASIKFCRPVGLLVDFTFLETEIAKAQSSPVTNHATNIELVMVTGPKLKIGSAEIEMWTFAMEQANCNLLFDI